jgi:hypothetical protein
MNNKTGVIGVNHLNTLLVRLATQCDFDNPQKNTAHSKRKYAITSLTTAKEDLGIANIKVAARHKSDDAHRQYQQGAPILHDRRIRAMWAANGGTNEIEGKCLGAKSPVLLIILSITIFELMLQMPPMKGSLLPSTIV